MRLINNLRYYNGDMSINKKFNQIVTELFIRERKLNISTVFITQSYFSLPKGIATSKQFLWIAVYN